MCLSSASAVGALTCEGCQYQLREPLLYLQDNCVACESLEDLQYMLRLSLLQEEDRLRAERDLVLLARDLRWALCFPPCPSAAPSSSLTSSSDDTLMASTRITLATEIAHEVQPAALASEGAWWRRRGGYWSPAGLFLFRASSWSERVFGRLVI